MEYDKTKCNHSPGALHSTYTCGVLKKKCECCGKQDIAYWCRNCGWGNIKSHKNGMLSLTQHTDEHWKKITE